MTIIDLGNELYTGLSTDTKPSTGIPLGSRFIETDTGIHYQWVSVVGLNRWNPIVTSYQPASNRFTGRRLLFTGQSATTGDGLLSLVTLGNGTGSAASPQWNTTDGPCSVYSTGTNNTSARGGWWGGSSSRLFNPVFTTRFRLFSVSPTNARLYIGFQNQGAQPTAGTAMADTYLNSKIGVLFGFRSTDTTLMIMSNNNQATATYTVAGTPSGSAIDGNAHTLSIFLDNATPAIRWSYDGTVMTPITDTVNSVPPSGTELYITYIIEAVTATSASLCERWSQFMVDTI